MKTQQRPTGLGHGVYKDDIDYSVLCGQWCIGRIYENRSGPKSLRWFWALHSPSKPGTLRILDQWRRWKRQGGIRGEWRQWKAWAKLEEVA